MYPRLLIFVSSFATVLATGACGNGIFNPPVSKPFVTVNLRVGIPTNTTTPSSIVATIPIRGGDISGQFNGHVVANVSSATETLMPGSNGSKTTITSDWILENDKQERILAKLEGITTYANNALHGFGYAVLSTDVKEIFWMNWATFLVEWQGAFTTGTAEFEFFQITSGGRIDGKPIPGLLPSDGM